MSTYDAVQFEPPAPVAGVVLRHINTGAVRSDVPMLLDTGADVTLIPQVTISELGVTPVPDRWYELIGFDGNVTLATVVQLELVFCQRTFRGQFLIIDQECGILGRNVLNAIPLLFNGPNLNWREFQQGSLT